MHVIVQMKMFTFLNWNTYAHIKVNIERINWNRICLFDCSASSRDGHRGGDGENELEYVQCACVCIQMVHTVLAFISILLCNKNAINILRENFELWILCAFNLNKFRMNAIQFMFIPIVFHFVYPFILSICLSTISKLHAVNMEEVFWFAW